LVRAFFAITEVAGQGQVVEVVGREMLPSYSVLSVLQNGEQIHSIVVGAGSTHSSDGTHTSQRLQHPMLAEASARFEEGQKVGVAGQWRMPLARV
jgi:hypothetical protein